MRLLIEIAAATLLVFCIATSEGVIFLARYIADQLRGVILWR